MNAKKSALTIAIGTVFAASFAAPAAHAADNPFGMQALKSGSLVAEADMGKDGMAKDDMAKPGKAKDGNCGAKKAGEKVKEKAKEGNCGAKKGDKK